MSYAVHITRNELWPDGSNPINKEEWQEVLKTTNYLEPFDATETNPLDHEPQYRLRNHEADYCFFYDERYGIITVTSGYQEQPLGVAIAIATLLNAVVQGDNFEYYPNVESRTEPSLVRPLRKSL